MLELIKKSRKTKIINILIQYKLELNKNDTINYQHKLPSKPKKGSLKEDYHNHTKIKKPKNGGYMKYSH